MVAYKLTYFGVRGLGEGSRLVLHYAGQPFEDCRLDFEQFAKLKETFPHGVLPVLEEGDKVVCQSGAIIRYLARKFDLNGKDSYEAAKADEAYNFFHDQIRGHRDYTLCRLGANPTADEKALYKDVFLPVVQQALPKYKKYVTANKNGYILPSGICYADLAIADHINTVLFTLDTSLAKDYPELVQFRNKVYGLPQLAGYIKSRPETIV